MYTKNLTKFQMAKIIESALYNMEYVCTPLNKARWREAIKRSRCSLQSVSEHYLLALDVLNEKGNKQGRDIIAEWVKQSIEGNQK